jgi:fermentation-respiration switch protein FrsA (DUF1100 family)
MAGLLLVAVLVVVVGLWLLQRRLIYLPTAAVPSPGAVGLDAAEPLELTTADGLELSAWYVPAAGEPAGAVLVLPGNAGNRAARAPLAAALRDAGLATLLVDYRGYGGNPGRPTQDGVLEDARAAVGALRAASGVGPDRLVYFGESLGAAVAAGLAAEQPPAALVLRSPFPSLTEVGQRELPWLPVRLLLRDRFPTTEWVARYRGPTLVVAGDADTLVPPQLSHRVADAAGGPVDVEVVVGAGHNDRALLDGEQMTTAILRFLDERTAIDTTPP